MANGTNFRVVPGGDESSESDDDGWGIGFMSEAQCLDEILHTQDKNDIFKKALTAGNVSVIEELLNTGINVESSLKFGWTPLMYAASVANVELMYLLLSRGANASFEKDDYSVLMAACTASGSEEQILKSVELLLSRNANPNAACKKKMTPLMYAAREGHSQVVALLVVHGSQVNAQDKGGYTALTWAACQGHKKVVFKLLELGADKSIQTKDGQTPGEIAKKNRHLELFSLLSLTASPFQKKFQNLTKEEPIHRFITTVPDALKSHKSSSYAAFSDMEVFLHGLELEHITELLKEREIPLRQLLTMGKEDLIKIGIENTRDQQKILDAVKELHIEEVKLEELSAVTNLEFSGDEFLSFLMKLKRQCIQLKTSVQNIINQFPTDAHKLVLEWSPPHSLATVCEDLILSAEDLTAEVVKLKMLMNKLQDGQNDDPCRMQPLVKYGRWKTAFLKIAVLTVVGSGCVFFIFKLSLKKN
ncbi:ankyrin repeat, SAM and basic leucine zipper domain-containing protein 1 [Protobothrops mucrosquamatus]|uniref:ankyrin repeat, SAM and basic leucine zipper domain-containing protein 1 n=1 Tax=Protobothrops mucrosquamatus TaxID=103944 RepID=UPI0007759166|nr:ankyrin repeat, SAM and basic leucine zipper domain-containing protein 1 [Protobothrops mucrosquamatus]